MVAPWIVGAALALQPGGNVAIGQDDAGKKSAGQRVVETAGDELLDFITSNAFQKDSPSARAMIRNHVRDKILKRGIKIAVDDDRLDPVVDFLLQVATGGKWNVFWDALTNSKSAGDRYAEEIKPELDRRRAKACQQIWPLIMEEYVLAKREMEKYVQERTELEAVGERLHTELEQFDSQRRILQSEASAVVTGEQQLRQARERLQASVRAEQRAVAEERALLARNPKVIKYAKLEQHWYTHFRQAMEAPRSSAERESARSHLEYFRATGELRADKPLYITDSKVWDWNVIDTNSTSREVRALRRSLDARASQADSNAEREMGRLRALKAVLDQRESSLRQRSDASNRRSAEYVQSVNAFNDRKKKWETEAREAQFRLEAADEVRQACMEGFRAVHMNPFDTTVSSTPSHEQSANTPLRPVQPTNPFRPSGARNPFEKVVKPDASNSPLGARNPFGP